MKKVKLYLIYGIIGVLCIGALAGVLVNWNRNSGTADIAVAKSSTPNPARNPEEPVVGIAQGDDYAATTKLAIENAGGMADLITKGCTVLIKPNICGSADAGGPIITDYRVVVEIVKELQELGAGKIIIGEGPIAGKAFVHKANGYSGIEGVEFVEFNQLSKEDCYEVKAENSLTGVSFFIPKVYMDADVVIGVPKMKTHQENDAVASLCLKNMFGVPPGNIYGLSFKDGLHAKGLMQTIIDLNKIRKPDFQVIDGIIGGEGYGPLRNDPVKSNVILAGVDPVAIDTVGLTFMGFEPSEVPLIALATEQGLGISDMSKIKVVGAELDKIKMKFKRH